MKIAAWNLNHRAGSTFTPFFPDAAAAIGALPVDVVVLTEYFPKERGGWSPASHDRFVGDLAACGFNYSLLSQKTSAKANRVLIAAKQPLELDPLSLPTFDDQMPSNVLAVRVPSLQLRLVGIRIPYYTAKVEMPRVLDSWNWLEAAATSMRDDNAIVIGDMNVGMASGAQRGGEHFRRIQSCGWTRAQPSSGVSYHSGGARGTEIDHALCSPSVQPISASYVSENEGTVFAGGDRAVSDHALLVIEVTCPGAS